MNEPNISYQETPDVVEEKKPPTPKTDEEIIQHTRAVRDSSKEAPGKAKAKKEEVSPAKNPSGKKEDSPKDIAELLEPLRKAPGKGKEDAAKDAADFAGRLAMAAWIRRGGKPAALVNDARELVRTLKTNGMMPARGALEEV